MNNVRSQLTRKASTSDASLFTRGKVGELREQLSLDKRDKNHKNKRTALKQIVANMTMSNNEMTALFPDIIACMGIYDLQIKKMCFLYLLTYARAKPKIAVEALPVLAKDLEDSSPLIRALALRTMASIPVRDFYDAAVKATDELLDEDEDPYVRKTAAYSVAKLWSASRKGVESKGLIEKLNGLLASSNAAVVAGALAALGDIAERSDSLEISIDRRTAFNLVHMMSECNEWSQTYILNGLMNFVPETTDDAVRIIDRLLPSLQNANSAVVLGTLRVIVYLTNYVPDVLDEIPNIDKKIGPALVILLSKPAEIQYLALRNCVLLLQSRAHLLNLDVKTFFCKYNDPIYVKSTKLEIIYLLARPDNISTVLHEFKECAYEIDVQVVCKAVRAIGKLAIKLAEAADACMELLLDLISTRVSYVVQESAIVIRNILRRYPNRYEGTISALCENFDTLDEPEAKTAMIWIIGQYADRIDKSHLLLQKFLDGFTDETVSVQLALLTAVVKLFILRPTKGQELVPRVLKLATEHTDNPDVRDRGFMYWRMLSSNPSETKKIVMAPLPTITADSDRMDEERLEELELCLGSLATIYLKPINQVFRTARIRHLAESPALAPRERTKQMETSLRRLNIDDQSRVFSSPDTESTTPIRDSPGYQNHPTDDLLW